MKQDIVLATSNPGKLRELKQILSDFDVNILSLADLADIPEPVEDADSFAGNARIKAIAYSKATGLWCIADDSGLEVDALNGAPGVYSARFAADRCKSDASRQQIDEANNALLLEKLSDIPAGQRSARFVCALAVADGDKILAESRGTLEGEIGFKSAGENGFGYDPLFLLPDRGITSAQLAADEKNAISHRGRALEALKPKLASILGN